MPEDSITPTEITADLVTCSIGDVTFDIAADSNPLLGHGSHTVNEYNSQKVSAQTLVADGGYESATLTVTFDPESYSAIKGYWESGTRGLTYSVTGGGFNKTYDDCIVRISGTPSVSPKANGYVTCTIEIQCLAKPKTENA
jgi:hypothetical protein